MVKVNVGLDLTLKMASGGGYNMFKPELRIHEIDTEKDLQPQIDDALVVIREAWTALEDEMGEVIKASDAIQNSSLLLELGKRMTEMEAKLATVANGKVKAGF